MVKYEVVPELADAIESRRKELGLTPGQLAQAAGVSAEGLMPLRKGYRKQYQDRLTLAVCRVLGWSADSIDRLLDGEAPVVLDDEPGDDEVSRLRVLRSEVEGLIGDLRSLIRAFADLHGLQQPDGDQPQTGQRP